jgi:hypothetical protein
MVTKQKINKGKTHKLRVIFAMPPINGCDCLYLVGKFDEWPESVYRMQRAEDGTWSLVLELEPTSKYEYRYRTDKGDWYTDSLPNRSNSGDSNHLIV